ncbi:MAG: hypothetical protein M3O22_08585 [Pseudomonadota bacterium]|nr:hypothetical protein [Pseudomonadota bacterium]
MADKGRKIPGGENPAGLPHVRTSVRFLDTALPRLSLSAPFVRAGENLYTYSEIVFPDGWFRNRLCGLGMKLGRQSDVVIETDAFGKIASVGVRVMKITGKALKAGPLENWKDPDLVAGIVFPCEEKTLNTYSVAVAPRSFRNPDSPEMVQALERMRKFLGTRLVVRVPVTIRPAMAIQPGFGQDSLAP